MNSTIYEQKKNLPEGRQNKFHLNYTPLTSKAQAPNKTPSHPKTGGFEYDINIIG